MTRSNFGGVVSRTSITYLKASGKASGNVNLPTPITAAPTTNRKWGRRNPTNLKITDLENFTSSCSTQFPKRCVSVQVHDAGAGACNFKKATRVPESAWCLAAGFCFTTSDFGHPPGKTWSRYPKWLTRPHDIEAKGLPDF